MFPYYDSIYHPSKTKMKITAFLLHFFEGGKYIAVTQTLLEHTRCCSKPFIINLFKPHYNSVKEVILFPFYKSGGWLTCLKLSLVSDRTGI